MKGIFKGALLLMLLVTFGLTSCGEKERNFIGLPLPPPNDVDDGGNPGDDDGDGSPFATLEADLANGTFASSGKYSLILPGAGSYSNPIQADTFPYYYPLVFVVQHKASGEEIRADDPEHSYLHNYSANYEMISSAPTIWTAREPPLATATQYLVLNEWGETDPGTKFHIKMSVTYKGIRSETVSIYIQRPN